MDSLGRRCWLKHFLCQARPINLMERETKREAERLQAPRPQEQWRVLVLLTSALSCHAGTLCYPVQPQAPSSWDWPVNNGPVISRGGHRHKAWGCVWPRSLVCLAVYPAAHSFALTVLLSAFAEDWSIYIEQCWFKHMLNLMHNASAIYSLIKSTVSTRDQDHTLWGWMCSLQSSFFLFHLSTILNHDYDCDSTQAQGYVSKCSRIRNQKLN